MFRGGAPLSGRSTSPSQLVVYHFMFGPDYEAGCPVGYTAEGPGLNAFALSDEDVCV